MSHPVAVGNHDAQPLAQGGDREAGTRLRKLRDAPLERSSELRGVLRLVGHDVELRLPLLLGTLQHLEAREASAHERRVRVARSGRRLVAPARLHARVRAAHGVGRLAVREVVESPVLHPRGQLGRQLLEPRHPLQLVARQRGRPVPRRGQRELALVVDRLLREEQPRHQVDEVRRDVGERLALLAGVEEPGRPQVRRSRHQLQDVVRALHLHGRLALAARPDRARHLRVARELPLQDRRDLRALGHHVVGDEPFLLGERHHLLELRKVPRGDQPRLVGEHVQARLDRGEDAVDLAAVAPRDDHDVARLVAQHALEVVRAGVDLEPPARRPLGALVERGDAAEVQQQIGPDRGEDVHGRIDARVHLLLDERGVEVPGVERHQPHGLCAARAHRKAQRQHQQGSSHLRTSSFKTAASSQRTQTARQPGMIHGIQYA